MTHSKDRPGQRSSRREGDISSTDLERLSETFGLLADPTRLRIVFAIRDAERNVGEIAQHLGLSEPSVSGHLRQLRQLRMVRYRAQGRMRFYQLDDDHVCTLLQVCLDHVRGG